MATAFHARWFFITLWCASCAMADPPNTLTPKEKAAGWQLLFDGQSLNGWRANEESATFTVRNGEIIAHGARSHLYYVGDVEDHLFHDFELELEVKTYPKANSGVYFHTQWQQTGWPLTGQEVQINNSHGDVSRTGGIYGIQDNLRTAAKDLDWFTLNIKVVGGQVTTTVDGRQVAKIDVPSKESLKVAAGSRRGGTFALQGHDPESEVHFRNIKVRLLDSSR